MRPIIDPKYIDNPELSDIRFKIDGKVVYGHRIVLVNASDEFKRLLDNPSGIQELTNVSYEVFKVGNFCICLV
jgi:ankyrin repeat and BTB/POZ domain-containing protein 2